MKIFNIRAAVLVATIFASPANAMSEVESCKWVARMIEAIAIMRDAGIPNSAAQRLILEQEDMALEIRTHLILTSVRVYSGLAFMTPKEILDINLRECE
jgi:hypothetical protein